MVVSMDSSRTMPDWVKYGVFWHVYPLGFCGADIRPAGPRQFHGRGLDAIIPWLEYVRDLGASGLLLFRFPTEPDFLYRLQARSAKGGEDWLNLSGQFTGDGGLREVLIPASDLPSSHFRLLVVPAPIGTIP